MGWAQTILGKIFSFDRIFRRVYNVLDKEGCVPMARRRYRGGGKCSGMGMAVGEKYAPLIENGF
jgi:hypothetical protein